MYLLAKLSVFSSPPAAWKEVWDLPLVKFGVEYLQIQQGLSVPVVDGFVGPGGAMWHCTNREKNIG